MVKTCHPGQLRESEFKAFLEVLPDQRDDEDLVTRNNSDEWRDLGHLEELEDKVKEPVNCIRHIVRVDRLKAVKVFRGFIRLPRGDVEASLVVPDIVGRSDWLPAVELYGEGIFITLDEARLRTWEQTPAVATRLKPLLHRFAQSGRVGPNPLTARFMLLHTPVTPADAANRDRGWLSRGVAERAYLLRYRTGAHGRYPHPCRRS